MRMAMEQSQAAMELKYASYKRLEASPDSDSQWQSATVLRSTKKELFVCPERDCGKHFPRSFALRRHMRIHTGTKPYACDVDGCTQRFNTSGNLSRHKRIHSGERPYACTFDGCGKRFNTSTKLKRHLRIHFPDGQPVFQCALADCSYSCDNYKEFMQHQKQHQETTAPTENYRTSMDENDGNHPDPPAYASYAYDRIVKQEHHAPRPRLPFPTEAFPTEPTIAEPPTPYFHASYALYPPAMASYAPYHHHRPSYYETHPASYHPHYPVRPMPSPLVRTPESMRSSFSSTASTSAAVHHHHHTHQEFTGEELSAVLELMKDS